MKEKPACDDLLRWLKANLGPRALAPLTGTDYKALSAAVHILLLYQHTSEQELLHGFGVVVLEMQQSTRYFAYHAIAYVSEWHYRDLWWQLAGLDPIRQYPICRHEPAGRRAEVEAGRGTSAELTVLRA